MSFSLFWGGDSVGELERLDDLAFIDTLKTGTLDEVKTLWIEHHRRGNIPEWRDAAFTRAIKRLQGAAPTV